MKSAGDKGIKDGEILMGNGAVARGLIEAGCHAVTGYPGTPSSEILEALAGAAKTAGIYVEWSVNEKVAFEVAYAAALAGVRAMAMDPPPQKPGMPI